MKKEDSKDFAVQAKQIESEAKTVRKIVLIVILSLFILIVIGITAGALYIKSALAPVDEGSKEEITFEIPLGSSTSTIADTLEKNNLIKDGRIFRFYIKFKNVSDFQAGEYTLSPSQSLDDIILALQSGKVVEEPIYKITIPEGKNIEQIANIFAKKLPFTADDFLETVNDEATLKQFMEQYPEVVQEVVLDKDLYMGLEGYLYATTYEIFEENPEPIDVIQLMVDRTNDILKDKLEAIETSDFSVHEVLTLAAIIERESKFSEDRPKVAQVYINRLNENMKLQSDITAFYGVENIEHKAVVKYADLEIDTPYNTYKIDGLPIGPIASPSLEAIEAVLKPEGEAFTQLYYFSRPNGETFYSDTLEQHESIVDQYRQEWYDLEKDDK